MADGYRQRFAEMVERLRQNRNAEIIEVAFGEPAPEADLVRVKQQTHGALPAGVEAFYRELNGFKMEWEHTVESILQHDYSDHGFIELLPIAEVFGEWEGTTWFSDLEGGDTYRPVKPFDYFQPEACAAFCQSPGQPPDQRVFYHYFGEDLECTNYTFPEYIERLLAARGYFYWIATLCSTQQGSREATMFRQHMPLIFDDYRDELFYPKGFRTTRGG